MKGSRKHIRETITAFLKTAGLKDRFDEHLAISFWDRAVGETIADHTEPTKVVEGILFVKVDDNSWRQELSYFKHEIIQKLNDSVGKQAIKEIKFI